MISRQQLWDMELEQLYKERETTDPDPEMWRWSPLELAEFDRMLTIARQVIGGLKKLRLCEAGSGIGTKLYLAEHYHDLEATGYEISKDYLAKAAKLEVDAREMDFRSEHPPWDEFDIVYIARPFKDDVVETAFEVSAQNAMKTGAVLMMAYTSAKPYAWPCFYRAPFRGIWKKPAKDTPPPQYRAMIQREFPYDPLVPTPVGYPG